MKKKILLLCTAVVTLASFAAVTGCVSRDDDDYYYTYDDVTFWNNQSGVGIITVTVDGTYTREISRSQRADYCNLSGSANFNLQSGYHTYYATSTTGEIWPSTSFDLNSSCLTINLYR